MALNVKAAMLLCMGFIGAMSWVANQVELPRIEVASPLGRGTPVDFARTLGSAAALTEGDADRRAAWARQLGRPNAMDAQAEMNRGTNVTLAVWSPSDPVIEVLPAATLPPLVGVEPQVALAAATPSEAADVTPPPVELATADPEADHAVAASRRPARSYRVARGDTLTGIARRHWNSDDRRLVALLVEANPHLSNRKHGRILVGEELVIPDAATVTNVLTGPTPAQTAAAPPATSGDQWYTIRRNDTLASIAERFLNDPRRWREIADLNGQLDPHKIVPGRRIKLPPLIRLARG